MPGCYSLPRKLTYSATSCYDACSSVDKEGYYSDNTDFVIGGLIYQDPGCSVLGNQGYYSDIQEGGDTCYEVNSLGILISTGICFSYITKFKDCNSDNTFRFVGTSIPSTVDNTYYISGSPFFDGCATIITDDGIGEVFDSAGVIFTLVSDCNDGLCPSCSYIEFCFGTTYPTLSGYSGNFLSAGTYSSKAYFTGDGISGGTIYHTGDRWCLSNTLGGICLLEGKTPCTTDCPDFASNSFDFGPCPTPTPTPVGNFTIDFNAYFDVAYVPPVTPTVSTDCAVIDFNFTNSPIPPTPSASPVYSLGLNFSIFYSSPTPTPSVTATPTLTPTNILEILGKATFTIIDPPFDCSTVKVLLVCGTVNTYYYVSGPILYNSVQLVPGTVFNANITSPNGTGWSCVQYIRDDSTLSPDSTINLVYSLFSKCENCLPLPSPTPTQTSTQTPTNTPSNTTTNTQTPTNTPTNTPTQTNTPTPSKEAVTPTPTQTPTNTPTNTKTPTQTPTNTPTNTKTPTNTPTNTKTPTKTPTPTNTETPTQTPTNTTTPTPTPTRPLDNFTGRFDTRNTNYIFDLVQFAGNNRATGKINISGLTITLNGTPTTVISTAAERTSEQIRQSIQNAFPLPVIVNSYVSYKYDIITTGGTNNVFGVADVEMTGLALSSVTPTSSSAFDEITLPFISGAGTNYSCLVDWGDGSSLDYISSWSATNRTHQYSTPGIYTINIYADPGNLSGIQYDVSAGASISDSRNAAEKYKILEVNKWGPLRLGTQGYYFDTCRNLVLTGVTDVLDLTNTTTLFNAFYLCTSLTTINRVNEWDTSNVQNMGNTFMLATNFNDDLSGWTTSAVTYMGNMFNNAYKFDKNIGNWDTHKVGNTGAMFNTALAFDNGGSNSISGWTMSANTTIGYMFYNAQKFNRNITGWERDTPNEYGYLSDMKKIGASNYSFSQAYLFNNGLASGDGSGDGLSSWSMSANTDMGHMFYAASSFNQQISGWCVSNVTATGTYSGMRNMFNGSKFNQDISNWERISPDVSTLANVRRTDSMFANCPFNNGGNPNINNWKITSLQNMNSMFQANTAFNQPIGSWDTKNVLYMGATFNGSTNFTQDVGSWNVSGVTTMAQMFYNATKFSGTPSMSSWDTRKVLDMSYLFANSKFDQDISNWNVSSATTMNRMFLSTPFNNGGNPDISGWTTSAVTDMSYMFYGTTSFNQPIDNWDVSSVTTMTNMFASSVFNQPLNSWITSEVTDMSSMFDNADNFDQDLGNWDLGSVTATTAMFQNTAKFDNSGSTSISGWTTSAVTNMSVMFYRALKFNQPIGSWNTSNVLSMASMFQEAPLFNQPLSGWNTSKVSNMINMFYGVPGANQFNQPIGNWNVSAVTNFTNFMYGKTPSTLSATNLTDIYTGWTSGGKTVQTGRTISFYTAKYTADGQAGKDLLTGATPTGYGWNITDGGVEP